MTEMICGVDEAGRGPGAGPVVAAAVILPASFDPRGLDDSKKLREKKREALFAQITQNAHFGVGIAEPTEIDQINVLHATMRAMERAVSQLSHCPSLILVDGNRVPENLPGPARAIIGGDGIEPSISAASIIAKVTRDRLMIQAHKTYPVYGFAQHKGYLTKQHLTALNKIGPCPIHRFSYAPVRASWAVKTKNHDKLKSN